MSPFKRNEGTFFDIQWFSLHDGPGIRTLVFLKGCSLRCEWCANPESQAVAPELFFDPARCIACENCLMMCTHGALHKEGERILFEKERCIGCGACAEDCYAEARVLSGTDACSTGNRIPRRAQDTGGWIVSSGHHKAR